MVTQTTLIPMVEKKNNLLNAKHGENENICFPMLCVNRVSGKGISTDVFHNAAKFLPHIQKKKKKTILRHFIRSK